MVKKITVFLLGAILLVNISGCVMLVAGAAAGAGTAIWLSGKLTQQFNAPYERTIQAAEKALSALKLELKKQTKERNVTQLISDYGGKDVWIDIHRVTESSTKVEVRVGGVSPDKAAATNILKRIESNL